MKKKLSLLSAIVLTMVMLLSMVPCAAAVEQKVNVDPDTDKGSVTITAEYKGKKVEGLQFTLYRVGVGEIKDKNLYFNLQEQLKPETDSAEKPIDLNNLNASGVKDAVDHLMKKIQQLPEEAQKALRVGAVTTDQDGKATFKDLPVGVYLAVKTGGSSRYRVSAILLYLPYTNEEGTSWVMDVAANPKITYHHRRPDPDPDPEPEIPPEEIPEEPVPMNPAEPEPEPETNLEEPEVPLAKLPQTGLLQWPIPVMTAAGFLLIAAGVLLERKKRMN